MTSGESAVASPVADGAVEVEVRPGAYFDSVSLMQVSRAVSGVAGVQAAQVAMGTDLNLEVLSGMGFLVPDGAGPNDLLVAIRADDESALAAARAAVQVELAGGGRAATAPEGGRSIPARTIAAAAQVAAANLALISVPGPHAFTEAMDALDAGLHVMVFSDNVPVEQEVRLKEVALERGLLVMGPDCGTAVVAGVGLGFANVVRPGRVGIVAASGTGAQQLMCLLDAAGVGMSHCLGVGGRDLSERVAARSTRQALAMLDADPATELIIVVSKPPAPRVADEVATFARGLSTPVHLALLAPGRPNLTEAAASAVGALGAAWAEPSSWPTAARSDHDGRGLLRGAFSGGTLCDEAMIIATAALGPIQSNIPLDAADPSQRLGREPTGHAMVDFGDDELTRGRPHPMIDSTLRLDWVGRQAAQPDVGVILMDVVLGHGSHPDPTADIGPAIERARHMAEGDGRRLSFVMSLCGTAGDPQGLARQAEALVRAGASVYLSNAAAARAAADLAAGRR
jgi:FdrA protein